MMFPFIVNQREHNFCHIHSIYLMLQCDAFGVCYGFYELQGQSALLLKELEVELLGCHSCA